MTANDNDWRLQGQEKYLHGCQWTWKRYRKHSDEWDHDHCAFCSGKFMEPGTPAALDEGYSTKQDYYWVCETCFDDFKGRFGWTVTP
jgi:hypothetical protein